MQNNGAPDIHGLRLRGFSLWELVIVTIVIGFMAAIAIPRYANAVSRYRADVTVNRIIKDLELAQQRAKMTSSDQIVRFNLLKNQYRLVGMKGMDRSTSAYIVNLSEEPYKVRLVSHDLAGDNEIIFDGYGLPDSGGTITFRSGNYKKVIQIDSKSGKANLRDSVVVNGP